MLYLFNENDNYMIIWIYQNFNRLSKAKKKHERINDQNINGYLS